jgi:hypothetical protein
MSDPRASLRERVQAIRERVFEMMAWQDASETGQVLDDVISLLSAEPARPQDTLRDAFKAGFSVAQHETDKYGEYHGESVEDEYRAWAAMGVEPTAEEK